MCSAVYVPVSLSVTRAGVAAAPGRVTQGLERKGAELRAPRRVRGRGSVRASAGLDAVSAERRGSQAERREPLDTGKPVKTTGSCFPFLLF